MKIFSSWSDDPAISDFVLRADNVVRNSGKDFYQPQWITGLMAMPMMIVRIAKVAKSVEVEYAERYFDRVSLAFSLRATGLRDDLPEQMKEDFDGSFVRWSEWVEYADLLSKEVRALKIIAPRELGESPTLALPSVESISKAISEVSKYYLLKVGDWIALPTMEDGLSVAIGNGLMMYAGDNNELIYLGIK